MRYWAFQISYLFFLGAILIAGYALVQIVFIPFRLHSELNPSGSGPLPSFQFVSLKPLDAYLEQFRTHALFYVPKAPEVIKKSGISELVARYEVTGLIQGAEPEALIQNRASKQTYFVQAGEQFDELKLVEIREHSIMVDYGGEQMEMSIQEGV